MAWAIHSRVARSAIALAVEAVMICLIVYPTWTVMWQASRPTYLDISVCEVDYAYRLPHDGPIPPGTQACLVGGLGSLHFYAESPTVLNDRVRASRPSPTEWALVVMSLLSGLALLSYLRKLRTDWDLGGY